MSSYKKFDNVFKSDQELHKKFIEKDALIDKFAEERRKSLSSYNNLTVAIVPTVVVFVASLFSSIPLISKLATDGEFLKIIFFVFVLIFLGGILSIFVKKQKNAGNRYNNSLNKQIETGQLVYDDVAEKVAQDLKNLYNAKMSEDNPLITILSDEPKNEVVLENGDTVSAVLKYNNDGLLIMKTFSKIETATPNTDYVKKPKQPYDVIDDLNNIDE